MATGITISTTSNMSNGQKIMIARAKTAFEPAAADPDLIESDVLPVGHKTRDILTYARLANSVQLVEGVDVSQVQQLVTNSVSVNPAEHGQIVTLSKKLVRRQADANLVSKVGELNAISVRARQALDVIALYDGISKTSPGAGSVLDITHFRGSIAYLITDNNTAVGPAPMPIKASLHAEQISDIILDLTDASGTSAGQAPFSDGLSAEMVRRWWRASDRVYGVQVWHGGYITRDTLNDSKGCIFSADAFIIVMEGDWEATEETDNSARLREYGLFGSWGEAERADEHAVEIHSDTISTL